MDVCTDTRAGTHFSLLCVLVEVFQIRYFLVIDFFFSF